MNLKNCRASFCRYGSNEPTIASQFRMIYDLSVTLIQSRLQHIYHWQPYVRVDLYPMPEPSLYSSQILRIWTQFLGDGAQDKCTLKEKRILYIHQRKGIRRREVGARL
jgi:hypothetical protein